MKQLRHLATAIREYAEALERVEMGHPSAISDFIDRLDKIIRDLDSAGGNEVITGTLTVHEYKRPSVECDADDFLDAGEYPVAILPRDGEKVGSFDPRWPAFLEAFCLSDLFTPHTKMKTQTELKKIAAAISEVLQVRKETRDE